MNKLIDVGELRALMGVSGLLFPPLVVLLGILVFEVPVQRSLSAYYHTRMYGLFVGYLFVVGAVLYAYKGYSFCENCLGYFAGAMAAGVGLAPPEIASDMLCDGAWKCWPIWSPHYHLIFTILLIVSLIVFAMAFRCSDKEREDRTPQKRVRNGIYLCCVIGICLGAAVCLAGIMVRQALKPSHPQLLSHLVLVGEWITVWSFSFAWLVKGQVLPIAQDAKVKT